MSKVFTIDSKIHLGAKLPAFDDKTIKDEPMMFSTQPSFAYEHGGPITKAFLEAALGKPYAYGSWDNFYSGYDAGFCFDSRVHMLMEGWWPCIPGFHHDDVPRSRSDKQPNYENPEYKAKCILALINADVCPTEFALGKIDMPDVPLGELVYKTWHPIVEQAIKDGKLESFLVPDRQLVHFDYHSFHQGTQARKFGWRWFGRLTSSAGYNSGRPHYNEIRRQVNVYMQNPMEGW